MSGRWLKTHVLPSSDCLARTENLQPVLRLEVRRTRSVEGLGGGLFLSQANITLTLPFGVLRDFPVVNAYPRGFAQELIASSKDSRDSYVPSGGRTSSGNAA